MLSIWGLMKEETRPQLGSIILQWTLLGGSWSGLHKRDLTETAAGPRAGNRAREKGIREGTCVSRWPHSAVKLGVAGSENPKGSRGLGVFFLAQGLKYLRLADRCSFAKQEALNG